MRRSIVFLFALLALSSCDMKPDCLKYDKSFDLSYGKCTSTHYNIVSVCFDSVICDSRCPYGVNCFWAGEAIARFRIRVHHDSRTVDLSTFFKKDTLINGYRFTFVNLSPYPSFDKPVVLNDYKARIMVSEE